jgi:transcriptional regulator with XRE-family HTH domain
VADDLGMTEVGYQNYELCKNEPKMGALNNLADYFDVSIDYLTGRSDKPKY